MVLVVWDNWGEHVCRQLSNFLIGAALSDVTISVGMKTIRTHRIILSFFSPFFKKMLDDVSEERPVVVVFPEVNFQALKIIIAYMYQGQVNVPAEILPHVSELAKTLKVKGLLKLPTYLNSVISDDDIKTANEQEEYRQQLDDFGSEAEGIVELEVKSCDGEPTVSSNVRAVTSPTAVTVITNTSCCASPIKTLKSPLHTKEDHISELEASGTSSMDMQKRESDNENQILIQSEDIQLSTVDDLTPTHIVKLSEDGSMSEVLFSGDYIQEDGSLETDAILKEPSELQEEEGHFSKKRGDGIYKIAKYGPDDLMRALEDLKAGLGTLREISERWGVPRSTLSVSARMAGISQPQKCSEYNAKALEEAKLAVKAGSSYMKAAKEFNIPKSVLWRKCQGAGIFRKAEHRFYNYSRENLLRARHMLFSGHSLSDIVKETKIPKTSVFRLKEQLVKEGKMPASSISRVCRPRKPSEGSLHQAVVACTEEGMSLSQASEKLQVAKTTIWRRLKRLKQLESCNNTLGEAGDYGRTQTIKVEVPDQLNDAYDEDMSVKYGEEDGRYANKEDQNFMSMPENNNHQGNIKQKLNKRGFRLLKPKHIDVSALESNLDSAESHTVIMEGEESYLDDDGTVIHAGSPLTIKQECMTDGDGSPTITENNANAHFQLEMPLVNFHGGGYQVVGSEIVIGGQHMVVLDSSGPSQNTDSSADRHIVVTPFAEMDVTNEEESSVQMEGNGCVKQNEIGSQQNSFASIYNHSQETLTVSAHSSQDIAACLQSMKPDPSTSNDHRKFVSHDRMTDLMTEFMSVD